MISAAPTRSSTNPVRSRGDASQELGTGAGAGRRRAATAGASGAPSRCATQLRGVGVRGARCVADWGIVTAREVAARVCPAGRVRVRCVRTRSVRTPRPSARVARTGRRNSPPACSAPPADVARTAGVVARGGEDSRARMGAAAAGSERSDFSTPAGPDQSRPHRPTWPRRIILSSSRSSCSGGSDPEARRRRTSGADAGSGKGSKAVGSTLRFCMRCLPGLKTRQMLGF